MLALACDLRVGRQSVRFVTAFTNSGFPATSAAATFCPSCGTGKARERASIGRAANVVGLSRGHLRAGAP